MTGGFDVVVGNVSVDDQPQRPLAGGTYCQLLCAAFVFPVTCRSLFAFWNKYLQDVGLRRLADEGGVALSQALPELIGAAMVIAQAFAHRLKRDEACRSHDAGLAQAAAEHAPEGVGTRNERLGAGQHGAHRGAESLGETKADAVGVARDNRWLDVERGTGVEQSGAVDMNWNARRAGELGHFFVIRQGWHETA